MSFTVENDPWIDWSVIGGPVDSYLYINLNPDLFDGDSPTFENYKQKYKPLEKVYNGTLQTQDIVEGVFIITQIGDSSIYKAPFGTSDHLTVINPENPYGEGRRPWRIESIPLDDPGLTLDIKYNSRLSVVSSDPKNVGRYDITIRATYIRNRPVVSTAPYPTHLHNGTYRGFWSSYEDKPSEVPIQNATFFNDINDTGLFIGLTRLKAETGMDDINIHRTPYKGYTNEWKFLVITPCPVTIEFSGQEFTYSKRPTGPEYTSSPLLLDTAAPGAPGNVPMRLTYSGDNVLSLLAPPTEIGTYTITATSTDLNYLGTQQAIFNIIPISTTAAAAAATADQGKIDILEVEVLPALYGSSTGSSTEKMTAKEFAQTGVLSILDETDIRGLAGGAVGLAGTANAIADCAKNLPQKLMKAVIAKVATLLLSYIPGLAIINLITTVLELINTVQKILALIEFIKNNPYAFLNSVLEASGAYAAVGQLANDAVASLTTQFPAVTGAIGDVGGFVKGIADGAIDLCNALDAAGNPISQFVKADNTKSPEPVIGFNPAVFRQPLEAKAKYDQFQLQIRGSLNKDNDKLNALRNEGNEVGLYEYAAMLTSVHELAYNYHDQVASRGGGTGLMTGNSLSSGGLDSDSLYDMLGEAAGTIAALTPAGSSSTNSGLSSSINAASNAIGGVTTGASAVGNFLAGGNIASLAGLKSAFNFSVKDTLTKNPTWSSETVNDYTKRVNAIKGDIESNADVIQNNPANLTLTPASQISSSSSSSLSSSSSSLTAGLSKSSPLFASIGK